MIHNGQQIYYVRSLICNAPIVSSTNSGVARPSLMVGHTIFLQDSIYLRPGIINAT